MSAGQLTCDDLANVQLQIDSIWESQAIKKNYIGKVEALTAIRENQTARLSDLENPDKNKTVQLYWQQNCDETTAACTDECSVGGAEPESSCQTHTLDICRTASFTVREKAYREIASNMVDAVAVSMLKKIKALDEYLARQVVTKLDTNKGVNEYTGGKGSVSGFTTNVNSAYWNSSLFGYLALVAERNKFGSPYLLSGTNLYEAFFNARMNEGNADGKGAKNMFDFMKIYFDIFNIDSQLTPELATFMLDANAVAFVSKAYYNWSSGDSRAMAWGGAGGNVGMKFSVPSKNLPGVDYDVVYKLRCSANEVYHDYTLSTNAGLFVNPVACASNNKGILKFLCA